MLGGRRDDKFERSLSAQNEEEGKDPWHPDPITDGALHSGRGRLVLYRLKQRDIEFLVRPSRKSGIPHRFEQAQLLARQRQDPEPGTTVEGSRHPDQPMDIRGYRGVGLTLDRNGQSTGEGFQEKVPVLVISERFEGLPAGDGRQGLF